MSNTGQERKLQPSEVWAGTSAQLDRESAAALGVLQSVLRTVSPWLPSDLLLYPQKPSQCREIHIPRPPSIGCPQNWGTGLVLPPRLSELALCVCHPLKLLS